MRIASRILLFLLLGALLTVAVAWSTALFSRVTHVEIRHAPPVTSGRIRSAAFGDWRIPVDWNVHTHVAASGPGVRYGLVTESVWMGSTLGMISGSQNRSMERVRVGWPLPALEYRGEMDESVRLAPANLARLRLEGIRPPVRASHLYLGADRRLPIQPVWAGFLIDTLLYAAILFTITAAPRSLIRARRRRRKRCPYCNYDLQTLTTCPECGK